MGRGGRGLPGAREDGLPDLGQQEIDNSDEDRDTLVRSFFAVLLVAFNQTMGKAFGEFECRNVVSGNAFAPFEYDTGVNELGIPSLAHPANGTSWERAVNLLGFNFLTTFVVESDRQRLVDAFTCDLVNEERGDFELCCTCSLWTVACLQTILNTYPLPHQHRYECFTSMFVDHVLNDPDDLYNESPWEAKAVCELDTLKRLSQRPDLVKVVHWFAIIFTLRSSMANREAYCAWCQHLGHLVVVDVSG